MTVSEPALDPKLLDALRRRHRRVAGCRIPAAEARPDRCNPGDGGFHRVFVQKSKRDSGRVVKPIRHTRCDPGVRLVGESTRRRRSRDPSSADRTDTPAGGRLKGSGTFASVPPSSQSSRCGNCSGVGRRLLLEIIPTAIGTTDNSPLTTFSPTTNPTTVAASPDDPGIAVGR